MKFTINTRFNKDVIIQELVNDQMAPMNAGIAVGSEEWKCFIFWLMPFFLRGVSDG
jgi:hypothetical protein